MKFAKQFLQDLAWDDCDEGIVVENTLIDNSRWSLHYRLTFKHDDKFYQTSYSRGATEGQDEGPFEYESDEIECVEVFPQEKIVTTYKPKL